MKAEFKEILRHSGSAYFLDVGPFSFPISEENVEEAKKIANTINCHDDLLESCKWSKSYLEGQGVVPVKIRNAITKAEGVKWKVTEH